MDKIIDDQILRKNDEITHRVIWIVGFTILLGILTSVLYFVTFHNYGLSDKQEDWASFGSYIGGVLGPIVALGSLFGLALLIDLQRKTVEATRDEMAASNKHFANQNFSSAVFELIKIITDMRQAIRWNPTNSYERVDTSSDVSGEFAISKAFGKTLELLRKDGEFSDEDCKKVLNNAYSEYLLTHRAFWIYWCYLKESLDEIAFRGEGVEPVVLRHGVRLFLTALSVREQEVFYLLHCVNREWERMNIFESSGVLDRMLDGNIERLKKCRECAINDKGKNYQRE